MNSACPRVSQLANRVRVLAGIIMFARVVSIPTLASDALIPPKANPNSCRHCASLLAVAARKSSRREVASSTSHQAVQIFSMGITVLALHAARRKSLRLIHSVE
jgi:hypothetical protein